MVETCSSEPISFLQKHSKGKGRHVGWGMRTLAEGDVNVMAWAEAPHFGCLCENHLFKSETEAKRKISPQKI